MPPVERRVAIEGARAVDYRWNRKRRGAWAWALVALGIALAAGTEARAIDILGNSATFRWSAATGPVVSYAVRVSRNDGPFQQEEATPADTLEATISGAESESIRVRVSAVDAQGNMGPPSQASQAVRFVSYDTPLDAAVPMSSQFAEPIAAAALEGDARLFVVERAGRIQILEDGVVRPVPFLDISDRVGTNGEGGLLGLAFDPDFALNALFYVTYTTGTGAMTLARFQATDDPNVADSASEETVLTVKLPAMTRLGGSLAFGPNDGLLYVAFGDGNQPSDPGDLAQDGFSFLGKVLRLDVSDGVGTRYRIPSDNPFINDPDVLDEIWALGLGHPRIRFDWATGDLWIVDVGQDAVEEINFEPAGEAGGHNYGWDVMEGTDCNPDDPTPGIPCGDSSLTSPVFEYDHSGGNCAIVGGVAYRGPQPQLLGQFVFGDLCTGRIWSFDPSTDQVTDRTAELAPAAGASFDLAAIAEDGFGALVALHLSGSVYRIGDTGRECQDGIDNDGDGRVDIADSGCSSSSDASELDSELVCDDGFDNDGDGNIDFPSDGSCSSASAASEQTTSERIEEQLDSSEGGSSSACGLGFELVALLPSLMYLYHRRRRRCLEISKAKD